MADLSGYTHKWRVTTNNQENKITKRNRQPTSCLSCRTRKLKCDRGHPCENCVKRGDVESCQYGKASVIDQSSSKNDSRASEKAQDRLHRLEELVKQMIDPNDSIVSEVRDTDRGEGPLDRDRHGTNYTGSTHWSAILDQIHELRAILPQEQPSAESVWGAGDNQYNGGTIFGGINPLPLPVILQSCLPDRKHIDRSLAVYFNAKYMVLPFIHTAQFRRQYEMFWDDQLSTSPVWISILFSIMCMADKNRGVASLDADSSPGILPSTEVFVNASIQCLVLGDYTRPQPFLIEAMCIHTQCKLFLVLDPSREIGLVFTLLVRQAYTMGYHRDPSKFPGQFTPFEGEMRRRTWAALRQLDLMISFQLGIPQDITVDTHDTEVPRNVLDSDIDEDTTVLPPPRPETEASPMLYFVVKARLTDVYSRAIQHSLSFPRKPPTNAEVMELDAAIRDAMESIPPVLRSRSMSLTYSDPSWLIMLSSNLLFVVNKSMCVLHRKYMSADTPEAAYSRAACIEASTRLVRHFIELHGEFAPGGQLYEDRWVLTSFTINDFLLAAMVLCFAIWQERKNYVSKGGDGNKWLESSLAARTHCDVLYKAQQVCKEYGRRGQEAGYVAQALGVMLRKIGWKANEQENMERGPEQEALGNPVGSVPSSLTSPTTRSDQAILDLSPLSMAEIATDKRIPTTTSSFQAQASSSSARYNTNPNPTNDLIWTSTYTNPPHQTTQYNQSNQPQPTPNQPTTSTQYLQPQFANPLPTAQRPQDPTTLSTNWVSFDQFLGQQSSNFTFDDFPMNEFGTDTAIDADMDMVMDPNAGSGSGTGTGTGIAPDPNATVEERDAETGEVRRRDRTPTDRQQNWETLTGQGTPPYGQGGLLGFWGGMGE